MTVINGIKTTDFNAGFCDNMLMVCPTGTADLGKALTTYADTSYIDNTIVLQTGTIINVRFENEVRGINYLNFNATGTTTQWHDKNGNPSSTVTNSVVKNGAYLFCPAGSTMSFVMIDQDNCAALTTFSNANANSIRISTVTLNGKPVTISKNDYIAGIVKYGTTNTNPTTTGSVADTTSTALFYDGPWFPIGIAGWNSNSRHYAMTRLFINNRRVYNYRPAVDEEYTGWTCDLHYMIYNTSNKDSGQPVNVDILWMCCK